MPFPPGFSIRALVCLTSAFSLPTPGDNGAPANVIVPTAETGATSGADLAGATGAGAPHDADVSGVSPAPHPDDIVRDDGAHAELGAPDVSCLSRTLCAIKEKIRWQTPAWSPSQCDAIARATLTAAKRHDLSPTLLLAVMINESDLNERSARVTMHDKKLYAKDSGLMAIRCVLDRQNRCGNGNVRGMRWSDLMTPANNIEAGAKELAYWRDGGASTTVVVKVRDKDGHLRPSLKRVPCRHKDHAYWAHYNHGPRYIATGYPRHYPHRVAVIDHALASVLNVDAPELRAKAITVHDAGRRDRTVDRPLETRYKKLCTQIQSIHACPAVAEDTHPTLAPLAASSVSPTLP